jgi:hypothetical protein
MVARLRGRATVWLWIALCILTSVAGTVFLDDVRAAWGAPEFGLARERTITGARITWGLWAASPALVASVAFMTRLAGPKSAAVAAGLAPAALALAVDAEVDDLNLADSSSTAVLVYVFLPFWGSVFACVVVALAPLARGIRALLPRDKWAE